MLSCLSNCCPSIFSRNRMGYQQLQNDGMINNRSNLELTTKEDHLNHHQKNVLYFKTSRDKSVAFYQSIPPNLCTQELGVKLIRQIFSSTTPFGEEFKLSLSCTKYLRTTPEIKRDLEILTRDLMCKSSIIRQNRSLQLLETYYSCIHLTNPAVVKNEKEAIPKLGTHIDWIHEANKTLDAAIKKSESPHR
ncbi:hypothetical protein DID80_04800 [Candidatus Marinamargulisbacteria bacterium SCGC AAA071-K20]|nr:hypothetical protein DID80_04800 [Candidatus Marinamargulisbacteria bacterium SCGC AAA071-K20]